MYIKKKKKLINIKINYIVPMGGNVFLNYLQINIASLGDGRGNELQLQGARYNGGWFAGVAAWRRR
jgi:hypothetical protein